MELFQQISSFSIQQVFNTMFIDEIVPYSVGVILFIFFPDPSLRFAFVFLPLLVLVMTTTARYDAKQTNDDKHHVVVVVDCEDRVDLEIDS